MEPRQRPSVWNYSLNAGVKMKFLVWSLFVMGISISTGIAAIPSKQPGGIWASSGQSPSGAKIIWSPNRQLGLKETVDGLSLAGKKIALLRQILSPPSLTEVIWASDSKGFVVNASDGGAVGTWKAYLYLFSPDGRLLPRNLDALISPKVRNFPHCIDQEAANFGAAGWMSNDEELLVVVEVPPHSSCQNAGAIEGFRVDVTSWKVTARIPEPRLRQDWKQYLGNRLVP